MAGAIIHTCTSMYVYRSTSAVCMHVACMGAHGCAWGVRGSLESTNTKQDKHGYHALYHARVIRTATWDVHVRTYMIQTLQGTRFCETWFCVDPRKVSMQAHMYVLYVHAILASCSSTNVERPALAPKIVFCNIAL